jgi:hypothetical protein
MIETAAIEIEALTDGGDMSRLEWRRYGRDVGFHQKAYQLLDTRLGGHG